MGRGSARVGRIENGVAEENEVFIDLRAEPIIGRTAHLWRRQTAKQPDQVRYRFDSAGRLSSIADRNNTMLILNYTAGRLTSITDTVGRVFSFAYDGSGHVTLLTDPLNRTVAFAYNAAGDLASATDARGKTTTS